MKRRAIFVLLKRRLRCLILNCLANAFLDIRVSFSNSLQAPRNLENAAVTIDDNHALFNLKRRALPSTSIERDTLQAEHGAVDIPGEIPNLCRVRARQPELVAE